MGKTRHDEQGMELLSPAGVDITPSSVRDVQDKIDEMITDLDSRPTPDPLRPQN